MPYPRRLSPRRARKPSKLFDPKSFLAQAGIGRAVHQYSPKQSIFSQGQRAGSVFYIQEGKVRLSVVSKQGKEATIAYSALAILSVRDASPLTSPCVWEARVQLRTVPSSRSKRARCCAHCTWNARFPTCLLRM